MKSFLTLLCRFFCISFIIILPGNQLFAQQDSVSSDNTETISIPIDYGGISFTDVRKIHLQRGATLVVNFGSVSNFRDKDNYEELTSQICYGDTTVKGYFDYLRDWAPHCIIFSAHTIGTHEAFSYTATNIPGTAYIYFHLSSAEGGMSDICKWLNTCVEVNVD